MAVVEKEGIWILSSFCVCVCVCVCVCACVCFVTNRTGDQK
jgi:hypothetical protein